VGSNPTLSANYRKNLQRKQCFTLEVSMPIPQSVPLLTRNRAILAPMRSRSTNRRTVAPMPVNRMGSRQCASRVRVARRERTGAGLP
jgi:hypothetical protein